MKAVVFQNYGGPEVLHYLEVDRPPVGEDEALVRVRACALNRLDLLARAGLTPFRAPLPHIGGCEIAGEIVQLGAHTPGLELGQRVVAAPYLACGICESCQLKTEDACQNREILGLSRNGGLAEFVTVPARNLVGIPENLSFEEAAAQALSTISAWHMLVIKAGVRPGETVLVHAAGSGVGSAAIQIARLWGARVIATASSAAKLQKAEELGADEVINYAEEDFAGAVMRLTKGRGADIVLEHIGQATWEKSLASLARGGRLVVGGTTTGSAARLNLWNLLYKEIMVIGSYGGTKDDLGQVLRLTEEGRLSATLDSTYSLAETGAAQQKLESRAQFGKILIVL